MSAELPMQTSIGPYRIVDFLGAGGMGAVYRVSHRASGKIAAAKVMNRGSLTPRALERFRNEARILQTMSHPGIAGMYDYLDVQGAPCLVMEYVDGETIEQILRTRGVFAVDDAVRIFASLVEAVSYVHGRGVVHRDLKTNNVKIDARGVVKLLDFGIAKGEGTPRLTSTGNVVGTLLSLAPEQLRTGRGEPRSDLWALGILFYEMLIGHPPFGGGAPAFIGERILRGEYETPSSLRPDIPSRIDRIIARCLKVRPDDRYATADALLADLREPSAGETPPEHRTGELWRVSGEVTSALAREWRATLAAGVALAASIFFVWTLRTDPRSGDGNREEATTNSHRDTVVRELRADSTAAARAVESANTRVVRDPFAASQVPDVSRGSLIIRVLEGAADVYVNEILVGSTPYTLKAPLGIEFQLRLRRSGCDDLQRVLRLDESMRETIESLPHCRTP